MNTCKCVSKPGSRLTCNALGEQEESVVLTVGVEQKPGLSTVTDSKDTTRQQKEPSVVSSHYSHVTKKSVISVKSLKAQLENIDLGMQLALLDLKQDLGFCIQRLLKDENHFQKALEDFKSFYKELLTLNTLSEEQKRKKKQAIKEIVDAENSTQSIREQHEKLQEEYEFQLEIIQKRADLKKRKLKLAENVDDNQFNYEVNQNNNVFSEDKTVESVRETIQAPFLGAEDTSRDMHLVTHFTKAFEPNLCDFEDWLELKVNRAVRLCKDSVGYNQEKSQRKYLVRKRFIGSIHTTGTIAEEEHSGKALN
ncbi:hypothetical protein FQR65_LT09597 [Abscondita terminalis]|nr:hypothetical protein FQR65_LT09597 [Abscondita terminalis]